MYFSNPWGLLALAAIPAIIAIHMYHRRFPPLEVAGLHLWSSDTRQHRAGRKRERLPITASLLLELLAALLLALVLSRPQIGSSIAIVHLVAVLDDSASMQGRPAEAGAPSFRDAAIAELERRVALLPRASVVTLIRTGVRPTMLAGPAVPWEEARPSLDAWQPQATRHAFEPAWDLGLQLVEKTGELVFITDHLPAEKDLPEKMDCVSVGRRLDNVAINAARWTFDSASGRGKVFVRVQNQGRRAVEVEVRGRKGEQVVFRRNVRLGDQAATSFEVEVPGGLQQLLVELVAPEDGLALDNRVELIEPAVRTVTYALTLPQGETTRLLRKVLDVLPDVQPGPAESAHLVFAPGGTLPEARLTRWWIGFGPLSLAAAAVENAKDLAGPYLIDKRHPLLDGIVLGGVVWGGVQPVEFGVSPLVSSGKSLLLSRLNAPRTVGYLFNIDLARSNLGESPDWPVLLANLVELRRENLPGLQRWNYRLGEDVRFRLYEGENDPAGSAQGELQLVHGGKSRPIARTAQVELSPTEPGVYEVRAGDKPVGRFAVNFQDAEESDLRGLSAGERKPRIATTSSSFQQDNPHSWLILLGLCLIVGALLGDWYVLHSQGPKS